MISLFTGTELSPNIFHPQFLNQRFIKKYLKAVANYAQGTMLDLGCGTKPYYEIFKNNIRSYYGLDALSFRKPELFINQKALTPDVFGDILNVPFKYNCIDTILCTQVIEHVKEPSKAVSEFYRILKKDGLVLLTCPQSYPIHDKENDYYRFTRFGIKYLFEKNGFAIKKIVNHGGFFVEQGLLFNIYFNYNLFKEGEGFSLLRVFLNILKVFVTPLLLLMNAFINILCILFDYFDTDMYFTHNYTIVAQKI
jgi:ubiquinone/menaquinone biosynthesis C-methylase UbiE